MVQKLVMISENELPILIQELLGVEKVEITFEEEMEQDVIAVSGEPNIPLLDAIPLLSKALGIPLQRKMDMCETNLNDDILFVFWVA